MERRTLTEEVQALRGERAAAVARVQQLEEKVGIPFQWQTNFSEKAFFFEKIMPDVVFQSTPPFFF